jgi:acetyl esterase/lipase
MGTTLGPDVLAACKALFDKEQRALAEAVPALAADCAYGPDARHRLDLYGTPGAALKPVLLFVHGGGFVMGSKGGPADDWANAAVGRMAARAGLIGAVINYRLAPDHRFPAGAEDVGVALAWLRANVAEHGGDPDRIVVMGTSAGAVHIAGWLDLVAQGKASTEGARGAVLLSGLYGYTPLDPKDERYYQPGDLSQMPRAAVVASTLPLFIACAEFDPPRFQAEFLGLMHERLGRHGALPRGHIASGHNHYSMAMHLGTSDRRLETEILGFVADVTGE